MEIEELKTATRMALHEASKKGFINIMHHDIKKLLVKYGANKVSELKQGDYVDYYKDLSLLLNMLEEL